MSDSSPETPGRAGPQLANGLEMPGPVFTGPPDRDALREQRRAQVAAAHARTPQERLESARTDGRTSQASLLVMPPIKGEADLQALLKVLDAIADPPPEIDLEVNPTIPFAKLRTVHFARLLVHYPSPSAVSPIPEYEGRPQAHGPPIPPKLLFATDFDGPLQAHVDELLSVAGPGLDQVFGHTVGWPGSADRAGAHRFFHQHRVPSNTFYTGTMHRSVDQIRREAELRDRIEAFLDDVAPKPGFPTAAQDVRRRIADFVNAQPDLAWAKLQPGPFPSPALPPAILGRLPLVAGIAVLVLLAAVVWLLSRWMPLWSAVLTVAVPVLLLAGAGWAAWRYLCRLAATDPVIIRDSVKDHTADLVRTEDRIVQNEMSSVIYIKEPLWFRGAVLRLVLAFINLSAKYLSNQGSLAGIPSIHFARWVIVDDGRRLVFFSNFDGSWENYLGDFIDKSHQGLTAVWSNCVGFPRTVGLIGEGATDEQRFKAYSRDSQVPTQVWYSAYKWLSVSNINNNSKIRLGLYGTMGDADAQAWVRRFASGADPAAQPSAPPPPAAPSPRVEVADVQGLVARSYKTLLHAFYVPVVLPADAAAARRWVCELAGRVTPASRSTREVTGDGKALNVAFTSTGVAALGVDGDSVNTFSREFQEGMHEEHRQRLLGDTGDLAPSHWQWGRPGEPLHAMLFLFAATPEALAALLAGEAAHASANGVALGTPLDSIMLEGDKEHFGFHDGIAQPRIDGLKADGDAASAREPRVPAGEVLLGYPNAYGKLPATASVPDAGAATTLLGCAPQDPYDTAAPPRRDLGRNGSYVVFRQYAQDVKGFWEFLDQQSRAHPLPGPDPRKLLGAKMVGRWPNGAPLVEHPTQEPPAFDAKTANDFLYTKDQQGERCPLGSHIRRSNPRDGMIPNPQESLLVADRHRLLRRGRAYGQPLAPSFDPADILASDGGGERGLHFITFNTDIARQFEFVQNTWINSMKFDGLYADPDPLVAPHQAKHPEEVADFTVMQCPVRHRTKAIPRFVAMRGGAYLFMPGLQALRYLGTEK